MADIELVPFNATYIKINTEKSIEQEIYDYFTFKVPNYEFMKRKNPNKLKYWSGDIHLYSKKTRRIYTGLESRIESFARDRGFILQNNLPGNTNFSALEATEFIKTLNLPKDVRYYQFKSFLQAVRNERLLIISPTASGKSLLQYLLVRYYLLNIGYRILLIVPTINLVHQMYSDFEEYGWKDLQDYVHLIYEGQDTITRKALTISTWQSIYKLDPEWFDFDAILCDEVHHAQSDSIKGIMEQSVNTDIRIGCTGTLNDTLTHRLVLEGLFGKVYQAATTTELIDQGYLAKLKIKAILLKHNSETSKHASKLDYPEEIEFLSLHYKRNLFIQNLALSLRGNTLILFRLVDKHGKMLYDQLKAATDRPVYIIYGGVEGEVRENIRRILTKEQDSILVGSYGTVSTGINIPSLHNIIFASPYKSRIKILQSIGRGLRLSENKSKCTVFDIGDDLTFRGKQNTTLKHFNERIKLYYEEDFNPKIYRVDL